MTLSRTNRTRTLVLAQLVVCLIACNVSAQDPPPLPENLSAEAVRSLGTAAESAKNNLEKLLGALDDFNSKHKAYRESKEEFKKAVPKTFDLLKELKASDWEEPNADTVFALMVWFKQVHEIDADTMVFANRQNATEALETIWNASKSAQKEFEKVSAALNALEQKTQPPAGDGAAIDGPTATGLAVTSPPQTVPLDASTSAEDKPLAIQPMPIAPDSELSDDENEASSRDFVDPFSYVPARVVDAPSPDRRDRRDEREGAEKQTEDEDEDSDWGASDVRDYRFDTAAHFPLPEFGLKAETIDREGIVIYEGMQFAIKPDGRYRVRFTMTTPAMPVTLRLQFVVDDILGAEYTVTLPPITVPPKHEPEHTATQQHIDPVYSKTSTVTQEGFLPALGQNLAEITDVTRRGTARFGFGGDVP